RVRAGYSDGNFIADFSPLDSCHSRRSHHVHDRVYRSYEHISRPAPYQSRSSSGSTTGGNSRGDLFLGLPRLANPWRAPRQTLERQKIHHHSTGGVGGVRGRLWSGPHVSRTLAPPFASGNSREWSLSRDPDSSLALVFPLRTSASQRV